jgi:uncharacterized phage protein (TIGR02216 family)
MNAIDWPGLMRAGLHGLGLEPDAFWQLTPAELRIMLGTEALAPPFTRARLLELEKSFPDTAKEHAYGTDRKPAGAGDGA